MPPKAKEAALRSTPRLESLTGGFEKGLRIAKHFDGVKYHRGAVVMVENAEQSLCFKLIQTPAVGAMPFDVEIGTLVFQVGIKRCRGVSRITRRTPSSCMPLFSS